MGSDVTGAVERLTADADRDHYEVPLTCTVVARDDLRAVLPLLRSVLAPSTSAREAARALVMAMNLDTLAGFDAAVDAVARAFAALQPAQVPGAVERLAADTIPRGAVEPLLRHAITEAFRRAGLEGTPGLPIHVTAAIGEALANVDGGCVESWAAERDTLRTRLADVEKDRTRLRGDVLTASRVRVAGQLLLDTLARYRDGANVKRAVLAAEEALRGALGQRSTEEPKPSTTCAAREPMLYGSRECTSPRDGSSDLCAEHRKHLGEHQLIQGTFYIHDPHREEL